MRDCISIYLGGDTIAADDPGVGHDTWEALKLRCPFCGQAVFLRRSHVRRGVEIPAAFCHYAGYDAAGRIAYQKEVVRSGSKLILDACGSPKAIASASRRAQRNWHRRSHEIAAVADGYIEKIRRGLGDLDGIVEGLRGISSTSGGAPS